MRNQRKPPGLALMRRRRSPVVVPTFSSVAPMDSRSPLDGRAVGLMVLVSLCFSVQQIALKAAAPDISPILQISLRSAIAAVLVFAFMVWSRNSIAEALQNWRAGVLAGLLFTLEYFFLGEGLRYTSAAHAVIFLYSSPIFSALGLHWRLPSERLSKWQWSGIILAFLGIAVAFLGPMSEDGPSNTLADTLLGDGLCLLAGLSWGMTTVVIRITGLSQLPAKQTLLYQLVVGAIVMAAAAGVLGQWSISITPIAVSSIAFQAFIVSFAIMLLWFWLLRVYLASRLGALSFLTPLLGVVLGAVVLGETIEIAFLIGALMVMLGILVVTSESWLHARQKRPTLTADTSSPQK